MANSDVPDPTKVLVLTQTTLSVDDTMKTDEILRRRFPNMVLPARKHIPVKVRELMRILEEEIAI